MRDLYPSQNDLRAFKERFTQFLRSDPHNPEVYELDGEQLRFESEQLIPKETDHRPGLLMVFRHKWNPKASWQERVNAA
jgi:hypothetical protein